MGVEAVDDAVTCVCVTNNKIQWPHNHTHLCNSVGIEGVGAHGAEVVEDGYGVVQGQQLLLVVLKYGDGVAEEDLAPLVEEGVPYAHHCLQGRVQVYL